LPIQENEIEYVEDDGIEEDMEDMEDFQDICNDKHGNHFSSFY
jgi:hypothetical protein